MSYDESQLADAEVLARARVNGWFAAAGIIDPDWPVTTAEAVRALRAAEYNVDPDYIHGLIDAGAVPIPPAHDGRYTWSASALVVVACALESRRRWLPFSAIHGHKMTAIEKITQLCEERGESAFADLSQFDLDGLLGMIIDVSHDRGAVQVLTEAVRYKLKELAVL